MGAGEHSSSGRAGGGASARSKGPRAPSGCRVRIVLTPRCLKDNMGIAERKRKPPTRACVAVRLARRDRGTGGEMSVGHRHFSLPEIRLEGSEQQPQRSPTQMGSMEVHSLHTGGSEVSIRQ